MIAGDQWHCAGTTSTLQPPEPPSDDETEDHLRESYNAGDRAAKRPRFECNHPVDDGTYYAAAGILWLSHSCSKVWIGLDPKEEWTAAGGKRETTDQTALECAFRELQEETGITMDHTKVIGRVFITGSSSWLHFARLKTSDVIPRPQDGDKLPRFELFELSEFAKVRRHPRLWGRNVLRCVSEYVSASPEPSVAPGETNGTVSAVDDDADAGEAITNHANGNRINLSEYPTIHERSIPSDVAFVTKLEPSVNGDERPGFSSALRESGGRLAIRAQVGMGKTTALELTLREMMAPVRDMMGFGEVEFVLFIGCRITQVSDLQQQFNGLGTAGTYNTLMNEKRYWRCGDDSPIQVTTTDSLHRQDICRVRRSTV